MDEKIDTINEIIKFFKTANPLAIFGLLAFSVGTCFIIIYTMHEYKKKYDWSLFGKNNKKGKR